MKYRLLHTISAPSDLKKIKESDLPLLADELRDFIIAILSSKEGHLGASLGVVELSIALHYIYNTPDDVLIWDVGHQAYAHKILTGRKENFHTHRQYNGISGFPKRTESSFDAFGTGHSSTSISAALGMAMASQIKGETERHHVAIIGDASIAAGMAFEGLNHAGVCDANLLVILNDNAIGIDPSVGALKEYLTKAKVGFKPKQSNMIEALNFNYSGPIDGHDISEILKELNRLKKIKGPKFLHLITTKGKGLQPAEQDQVKYHAPGKFDKITGEIQQKNDENEAPKYQDVFGHTLVELAKKNEKIIGITPAMPTGSSLKYMIQAFPDRAFDVGIAEQHAVTLAAGMASQGLIPYCNIYSTFAQRAYDQIIHDVALQKLPVIFCLDRAGLVGEDGATHHGAFDISFLRCIPNLILFAPMDEIDLRNILYTVQLGDLKSPIAIRYPRGKGSRKNWRQHFEKLPIGKGKVLREGNAIAVLSIGTIGTRLETILGNLPENETSKIAHYNLLFIKPLDKNMLLDVFTKFDTILTFEENVANGGFGSAILEFAQKHHFTNKNIRIVGYPDSFVEHGSVEKLEESISLDDQSLKQLILQNL